MKFDYETTVIPEWIDYNGHMQDCYYGLVFSLAVDATQEAVAFDQAYRESTGCTIYLLEDHKYFLKEVKVGALVQVQTRVLDVDAKKFQLHLEMSSGSNLVAACEFIELHVQQNPKPHAVEIPGQILEKLKSAKISQSEIVSLRHRSRELSIRTR